MLHEVVLSCLTTYCFYTVIYRDILNLLTAIVLGTLQMLVSIGIGLREISTTLV